MAAERAGRKIAAILAADVAGYSRLAGAEEERTLARLRALRSDLIDPVVSLHHGRVVKRTGDGALVEFRSVVDAVRCGLDLQAGMAERNAGLPPERRIEFRVGIHLGDVVEEADGDLMGDGVNIAARLESIADPGGICLSEDAWRQVRDRISEIFVDRGEQALKNIARPMRVYALNASVAWGDGKERSVIAPAEKPSIAALPFQNMSGEPEQDYFCDGVVEDILTALSKFSWLFVIARNSSFTYKGQAVDVKTVGRELGVRYVLEGSVRKAGARVRITGQLIEAATGVHLWAERYDRALDDIFAVQDEIVAAIVGTLVPEIGATEIERAQRKPPQSLDAWDVYQRGLNAYYKFGPSDIPQAQKLFDDAIALSPDFPDAYVFRALTGIASVLLGYAPSPRDVLDEARGFAQRALHLDEGNALAHTILGRSLMLAGRHDAAIAENRLAIELNPNLALAHYGLGAALLWAGRAEQSIPHLEQSLRLSPRDPISSVWRNVLCQALTYTGAAEAALAAIDAALRQRPDNPLFLALRALPLVGLDRVDEARAAARAALARNPTLTLLSVAQSCPNLHGPYMAAMVDRLRLAGIPEG